MREGGREGGRERGRAICASTYPAANKYQASAWSPKQTQEFELYPQASPLAERLCVPSGKPMNVGSNPAVGASFFRQGKLVSATDTEQVWP